MRIYVLIEKIFNVSRVKLASSNIEDVKRKISEMCRFGEYPEFQIWENGQLIQVVEGDEVLKVIVQEYNQ